MLTLKIILSLDKYDASPIKARKPQETVEKVQDSGEQTFYKWKARYDCLEGSEAQKLKALEDENLRGKQIVADQAPDIQAIKFLLEKMFQGLTRSAKPLSSSRAYRIVCADRSTVPPFDMRKGQLGTV